MIDFKWPIIKKRIPVFIDGSFQSMQEYISTVSAEFIITSRVYFINFYSFLRGGALDICKIVDSTVW